MTLPRLEPLPLAYMVSPSVPFLELSSSEDPGASPTTVSFFATHRDGSTSRMRFVFRSGVLARLSPAYSDREVVKESDYDWSSVPRLDPGPSYHDSVRRLQELEKSTGLCPDPNVYDVVGSPLLVNHDHRVGREQQYLHHYLVLGHDAYVDVLATGWHDEELSERKMLTPEAFDESR